MITLFPGPPRQDSSAYWLHVGVLSARLNECRQPAPATSSSSFQSLESSCQACFHYFFLTLRARREGSQSKGTFIQTSLSADALSRNKHGGLGSLDNTAMSIEGDPWLRQPDAVEKALPRELRLPLTVGFLGNSFPLSMPQFLHL